MSYKALPQTLGIPTMTEGLQTQRYRDLDDKTDAAFAHIARPIYDRALYMRKKSSAQPSRLQHKHSGLSVA